MNHIDLSPPVAIYRRRKNYQRYLFFFPDFEPSIEEGSILFTPERGLSTREIATMTPFLETGMEMIFN